MAGEDESTGEVSELVDHLDEEAEFCSDMAIRRLDHVYNILEQIAKHSGDGATVDATKSARNMIEAAQLDVTLLRDEIAHVKEEVRSDG